jgi:hypothetical protein
VKSIIRDIQDLVEHANVISTLDADRLMPSIRSAERVYIKQEIGAELYAELVDYLEDDDHEWTDEQTELLTLLRDALASFSVYLFAPIHQVQVDSQGIRIVTSDDRKTAFAWQVGDMREAVLELGEGALENALEYLEEHQDDFPTWTSSPAYTKFTNTLIRTSMELNDATGIVVNRRLFRRLKNTIMRIERDQVKAVTGKALYDALLEMVKDNDVVGVYADILSYLRPAIGYTALAEMIIGIHVKTMNGGITVLSSTSKTEQYPAKESAEMRAVSEQWKEWKMKADGEFGKLAAFLQENAGDVPEFLSSGLYVEDDPEKDDDFILGSGGVGML